MCAREVLTSRALFYGGNFESCVSSHRNAVGHDIYYDIKATTAKRYLKNNTKKKTW